MLVGLARPDRERMSPAAAAHMAPHSEPVSPGLTRTTNDEGSFARRGERPSRGK